jgi:hypothetical protein
MNMRVRMRHATSICLADADRRRHLAVLDSEIGAFNDLLTARAAMDHRGSLN